MRRSRVIRPDRSADLNGALKMAATKNFRPTISSGRVIDAGPIAGLPTEGDVDLNRPLGDSHAGRAFEAKSEMLNEKPHRAHLNCLAPKFRLSKGKILFLYYRRRSLLSVAKASRRIRIRLVRDISRTET
jgi:hypothetical protein